MKKQGWICPICSLESKRRWNTQRHIRRQHGESRLEPLDALTMETRDEKYQKHIVEEQGKLVQNISKQFGPIPYTVSSTNPFAFNYTLVGHIGNTPSSWPYFMYANLYHSCGTDILDSTEEFLNSLAYNQQEFRNLTLMPAYNLLAFSHQRAMVHMNPLRLSIMPPSSMVPLRSLSQYPLNRAAWNNVFYTMTKMKALTKFVCRDKPSENDKLILGYRVHTCHRCLTTDNSIIRFEYNAASEYVNDSDSSFWRSSVSYSGNHVCDEEYYREIICGLCPPELEESKKCVMMERNSGQFLLKAISSGSWIEKTKSLVALKIPPRPPDDGRFHVLINCQIRLSVGSTSNTKSVGCHQPSSSLVPISARINLQDISLIEFTNSNRD